MNCSFRRCVVKNILCKESSIVIRSSILQLTPVFGFSCAMMIDDGWESASFGGKDPQSFFLISGKQCVSYRTILLQQHEQPSNQLKNAFIFSLRGGDAGFIHRAL